MAWGFADTSESAARAFDPQTFVWETVNAPNLASCNGSSGPIVIGSRLLILSMCDHDAALYDPVTQTWESLPGFRQDFDPGTYVNSDYAFWTGSELVGWLSGHSGTELSNAGPQLVTKHDSRLRG